MTTQLRERWGSGRGFVMATLGSAVADGQDRRDGMYAISLMLQPAATGADEASP